MKTPADPAVAVARPLLWVRLLLRSWLLGCHAVGNEHREFPARIRRATGETRAARGSQTIGCVGMSECRPAAAGRRSLYRPERPQGRVRCLGDEVPGAAARSAAATLPDERSEERNSCNECGREGGRRVSGGAGQGRRPRSTHGVRRRFARAGQPAGWRTSAAPPRPIAPSSDGDVWNRHGRTARCCRCLGFLGTATCNQPGNSARNVELRAGTGLVRAGLSRGNHPQPG
jgi:hypothetical protein